MVPMIMTVCVVERLMLNISVHLHRNSTAKIICTFGDETRPILEFFFSTCFSLK